MRRHVIGLIFLFNDTATTEIYTLSLHDALPIYIGYQEMLELASYGAKMHPRSIELGAAFQIPIYVASSFKETQGTLIHQKADERPMEDRIKVTGIAYDTNVAKITVRSVPDRPGIAAALFEPLRSEERRVGKECRSRGSPYH